MDRYDKKPNFASFGEDAGSSATATATRMKEQVSEKATEIRDKVTDFGRKTVEKIDDARQPAADALDQTAYSLHSGGEELSSAAHAAAEDIQATADYVRQTRVKGMANDAMALVRRHPGLSLAAAALAGFLVARVLSDND